MSANNIVEMEWDDAIASDAQESMSASALEIERRRKLLEDYQSSPEFTEKIMTRLKINDACMKNTKARQMIYQAFISKNSIDDIVNACIQFIELFGFTEDPRPQANPHDAPFIMYPFQREAVKWMVERIERGEDGLIEKSRDMGMTWTAAVWVPIYYWLFRDNINILVGSYKEDLVDNHGPDSIMGKMDYAIRSLPKWILPKGWNPKKNRTHLKFVNSMNWNIITGDTMNPNFGRGSRKTVIIFDELAFWDYAKEAWEAASQSTACRIALSTPQGMNYYGLLAHGTINKLTLHWTKHPLHDETWYNFESSRMDKAAVAQELDISYSQSVEGRVYPEWSDMNISRGNFPYMPDWPLYIGWDFGRDDGTAIIWAQKNRNNGKLRIVEAYYAAGKTIKHYIPIINGQYNDNSYSYTEEEITLIESHKIWSRATHFGDPAGRFQSAVTDQTIISILRDSGINVNYKDEWKAFNLRIPAVRELMNNGIELNSTPGTRFLDICMLNSAYPKVRDGGNVRFNSVKPKHDSYSHHRSAFEYLALGLKESRQTHMRVIDKQISTRSQFNGRRAISY